jgi:hypothetical protein
MLLDQTFLEFGMMIPLGALGAFRQALHGDAKLAQIVAGDVQDDVAVMKMGGISTAVTETDRPSALR